MVGLVKIVWEMVAEPFSVMILPKNTPADEETKLECVTETESVGGDVRMRGEDAV